jgi:thiol-disulfide isomerase/thioredoxin
MRYSMHAVSTLVVWLAPCLAVGVDQKPVDTLAAIKKDHEAAQVEFRNGRKPGMTDAEQKTVREHYRTLIGDLCRRALALVESHPDNTEAVDALLWAHSQASRNRLPELYSAVYDAMAKHYLDSDAILRVCSLAFYDILESPHPEAFLRTAVERSNNVSVRGVCCLSLGRFEQDLAKVVRDLNDPVRGEIVGNNLEHSRPGVTVRLRALDPEKLERESTRFLERTIKEFGGVQPLGDSSVRLGERAAGEIFQKKHLAVGRIAPDIEGEDIDGKPMRLSDFRGKVVVISFWATWCGPCMTLVPDEKALIERMKGRPFVLIGVNGDDNRERVKAVSAEKGINWRSFWSASRLQGIPLQWGVSSWPTIFVIDRSGVIRDNGLVYFHELHRSAKPNQMIESLVAEAEQASKR